MSTSILACGTWQGRAGGHKPSEGVSPSKAITAQPASVVTGLQMDAVVVSIKVRLSLELFGAGLIADHCCAWMWVLALWVVSFHMRLPVVASLKKLAADSALVGGFLRSSPLALLLDAVDTWKSGRARVKP